MWYRPYSRGKRMVYRFSGSHLVTCFTLLLAILAVLPMGTVCAIDPGEQPVDSEEGSDSGTKLGITSFSIAKIEMVGNTYEVTMSYDATQAGSPWQGGIFGYGEIEKLVECEVTAYFYREDDAERANELAARAREAAGFRLFGNSGITTGGLTQGMSSRRNFTYMDTAPLSGQVKLTIEFPYTLKYLRDPERYYVVFIAVISYRAFNGAWTNVDARGPVELIAGADIVDVTISIDAPSQPAEIQQDIDGMDMGKVNINIHLTPRRLDGSVEQGTATVGPETLTTRLGIPEGTKVHVDIPLDLGKPEHEIDCEQLLGIEGSLKEDEYQGVVFEVLQTQGFFRTVIGLRSDQGVFASVSHQAIDADDSEAYYRIESVEIQVGDVGVNLKSSVLIKPLGNDTVVYSLDGTPEVKLPFGSIIPLEAGNRIVVNEDGTINAPEEFDQGSLDVWWETDDWPSTDEADGTEIPVWFSKNFPFPMPIIRPVIPMVSAAVLWWLMLRRRPLRRTPGRVK
jgi:hypothetical protein